jgi:hypothetical protein
MAIYLLIIVGCSLFFYFQIYLPRKSELREQRRKSDERRLQQEENEQTILEINSYFEKYILKDTILLDSNIWMNPDYESFFITLREQLKNQDKKLVLYGPQFDEICNIKKRTGYRTIQNRLSRLAINRIEEFQINNLLKIKPLTIDAEKRAYADPLIIKMVLGLLDNNEKVVFISDDKELRIRMRGFSEEKKNNCVVVPGKDLIDKSKSYCKIKELYYEEPNIENYYSEADKYIEFQVDKHEEWESIEGQVA